MRYIFLLLVFLATAAKADECFFKDMASGFQAISNQEVLVYVGADDYDITTTYCPNLEFAQAIGFQTFSNIEVCTNDHILVLDQFHNVVDECWITNMTKNAK